MSLTKEIEVIGVEIEQNFFAQNDRVVRKKYQTFCIVAANSMILCYGLIFLQSGFIIPQMEDSENDFGIDKEQGSWFGILGFFWIITVITTLDEL